MRGRGGGDALPLRIAAVGGGGVRSNNNFGIILYVSKDSEEYATCI